jgi:hypothetical protein
MTDTNVFQFPEPGTFADPLAVLNSSFVFLRDR